MSQEHYTYHATVLFLKLHLMVHQHQILHGQIRVKVGFLHPKCLHLQKAGKPSALVIRLLLN